VRRCYICGRESERRVISEPLMVPVCLNRECGQMAARLRPEHCRARLETGQLCGAPAARQIEADGQRLCAEHLRSRWAHARRTAA
jgi:hypothetical protein